MRAPLLLAAILLAGCTGAIFGPAPPEAPLVPRLAFEECTQTHTFAAFPIEAFEGVLPEGWSLQTADPAGRTTQLYLAGSACERALVGAAEPLARISEYKEVFGYLFVVPPNGTDANVSGDLWPLAGVVSHGDALRAYEAHGLGGVVAQDRTEIRFHIQAGPVLGSRTYAENANESFEVEAAAQRGDEPFHDGAFRVWVPSDDQPTASLLYAWPEGGTDLGLGSGTFSYRGPRLQAPPEHAALVHHVSGVAVTVDGWT